MLRIVRGMSLIVTVVLLAGVSYFTVLAQDATGADTSNHAIVGTWLVDTIVASDTDSPEVGIFMADGTMVGQGANRVAGGAWEVIDDRSVTLTLVTVSDQGGVGTYVVVRGTHVLDDSGNRWTCDDCGFTVVSADGKVLDSGTAPASAIRMPVQRSDAVGTALDGMPAWSPVQPESTPSN